MLTIYRASAGSGKTFTLAVRYLTLLVENPQSYRSILAVTFTNKATEEMKLRILSQLYGLWQRLPESDGYAQQVCKATGMGAEQVAQRAGMALSGMMHHYSMFRVETIDAFFQTVLKGVARELGLTSNWRLSLNDHEVEETAVDQLIDDLADDAHLRRWIMTFVMERMQDNRSWNVIGQLKEFGRNIFADFYKREREALTHVMQQEGFFEQYTRQLRELRASTLKVMQQLATDFRADMSARGLDDSDLYRGSTGLPAYLNKLCSDKADEAAPNSYVMHMMEGPSQWASAKTIRAAEVEAMANVWTKLISDSFRLPAVLRSCDAAMSHLHLLRLLGRIQHRVEQLNHATNRLLLSDTQQRLSALIDGSDTPFIYEKIGAQLEHVMIDEFQDTSQSQWHNFRLLLDETMSHRVSHNLIVGDVKQSIYRWRGGDWQLLSGIDGEFNDKEEQLSQITLHVNWRSDRRVVEFNNAFFRLARDIETEVGTAYDDVEQQVPEDKPANGTVEITLLPEAGIDGQSYDELMKESVVERVRQLTEHGVKPKDIAILVRYNRYLPQLARLFSDRLPSVPVVSDEAFRLDASLAVNTLIWLLTVLVKPDDQLARAAVLKVCNQIETLQQMVDERETWLSLPVTELLERLYQMFRLDKIDGQSAYVCAFFDAVSNFQADHVTDVRLLLDEWEQHICAKTVQTDAIDGVRLLSIHRSKGLEFGHVLLPYCDWTLESSRTILWCHVDQQPFAQLPLIPVSYSRQRLAGTPFEPFAEDEHRQAVVDNLNLLYVAMTRAVHGLYVIGQRRPAPRLSKSGKPVSSNKAAAGRSWLLEQCLPQLQTLLPDSRLDGLEQPDKPLTLTVGQLSAEQADDNSTRESNQTDTQDRNPFLAHSAPIEVPFTSMSGHQVEYRQSADSQRFVASAEEDDETLKQTDRYINAGLVLHQALSLISTPEDVPTAFRRLELDGVLASHTEAARYQRLIEQRMQAPEVAAWFAPGWRLFRECSILVPRPHSTDMADHYRPDRVMTNGNRTLVIDYKFGRPRTEYIEQVQRYMQLLRDMQMPGVEGYLWFVYTGEVVRVNA